MKPLPKFSDPRLSLWQSAVSAVLHRQLGANDPASVAEVVDRAEMRAATRAAEPYRGLKPGAAATRGPAAPPWFERLESSLRDLWHRMIGRPDVAPPPVQVCADLYLKIALATDPAVKARLQQQVLDFGNCDPCWGQVLVEYEEHVALLRQPVPYVAPTGPGDSVIDALPGRATIGLLADWGTGTPPSVELLGRLAAHRKPGVPFLLIHLGDVYYSGTTLEFRRFVGNCRGVLGPDVPIFALSGNHDMYAGGRPYYDAIAALNAPPFAQRASYFNLRNAHWQFQAMDTGLNDRDPWQVDADTTFLDPAEVRWHRQQLDAAGGRRVVLLSHHQPFSAFARIGGGSTNDRLLGAFDGRLAGPDGTDHLPGVALWLWGHEHSMVFYGPYAGVARGRCIGSGAIPVSVADDPYRVLAPAIPFDEAGLSDNDGSVYSHGYAVMEIDGPGGRVEYYQDPDPRGRNPLRVDVLGP